MSETPPIEPDLGDELRSLGKNLSEFLRAAWAGEERKRVQQDIESSLSELGKTIDKAANDFSTSETGQRLKSDIHDFQKRVETGEAQQKARSELLAVLKKVNQELTKAADKWGPTPPSSSETASGEAPGGPAEGAGK